MGFLDDYVVSHFSDEEGIQKNRQYPGYSAHKREHDGFITRLKALKDEVKADGVALHHVTETNNMLLKWLINHIAKVDGELGAYLRANVAQ